MKTIFYTILLFGFFSCNTKKVASGPKILNFSLYDLNEVFFNLYEKKDKKAIVLFIYEIGCPIARQQIPKLNEMQKTYAKDGIEFYLLIPSFSIEEELIRKEVKDFKIELPILIDRAQSVARLLNLKRTADTFLIETNDFRLVYRGALNSRFDYGTQKDKSEEFLENSIKKLKNENNSFKQTEAKGCLINLREFKNLSYSKDIVPILDTNCLKCHNSEGRGPWTMDSHIKLVSWSKMMKEVVLTKRMPLRQVSGGDFELKEKKFNGLPLIDEAKLLTWLESDKKADFKNKDPLTKMHKKHVDYHNSWPWGEPDLIIEAEEAFEVAASGWSNLQFRYVKMNKYISEDKWLRAAYFKPGSNKVTHDATAWISIGNPELQFPGARYVKKLEWKNNPIIKRLIKEKKFDWKSDLGKLISGNKKTLVNKTKVGRTVLETIKDEYSLISNFNSSENSPPYPKGTTRFLPKDSTLRFAMHFKTIGRPVKLKPKVGLYFKKRKKNERELIFQFIQGNFFVIPPNKKMTHRFYHVLEESIKLYASSSHLHYRGRAQKLLAHFPDGSVKTIFNEPNNHYDGNILGYYYKEPIILPKGTVIESISKIDNTKYNTYNPDSTTAQRFNLEIKDEMIWATLTYSKI
jgi:hypothetical protein